MNFKSVTINLLLTTLSAGVLLQTLEAQAASITFGEWTSAFTVTESPENRALLSLWCKIDQLIQLE